jgi:hypothetical protein
MGNYNRANEYLEKTVDIYRFRIYLIVIILVNMEINLALSLLDLGDVNRKMKMYKTAYLNYQESLAIN